jgi:hypothetical protein
VLYAGIKETPMGVSSIRMPDPVHDRLRAWAQAEGRSLNDLAVEILDRESRRWQARQALAAAIKVREAVRARVGEQPDSTPLIRELREERTRRG